MTRSAVWLVAIGFGAVAARCQTVGTPPPAPNILLVVADDLGWGDLAVYNPSSQVSLPTLEGLAAAGVVVTNAHSASSVCAPSRYSILSGNNPWRGRYLSGQWDPYKASQLLAGQETLGDLLRRAGYRTGFFGKWHLGAQWHDATGNLTTNPEMIDWSQGFVDGPADHGFDESLTALCGWQRSPYTLFDGTGQWVGELPAVWMQPPGETWSSLSQSYSPLPEGYGDQAWEQELASNATLEAAAAFIAAHADERFFVQFNAFQPHWSWTATGSSGLSARVDQVLELDRDLAVLLQALETAGATDSTLVIVTSDNGGDRLPEELANGHDASAHLRGQKGVIYEGGHRVPFVARWPQGLPAGRVLGEEHRVGLHDLYATLAAAAGVSVAADQGRDSFNQLCPLATEVAPVRATLMVQDNRGPNFAFYRDRWKLTLDSEQAAWELFDLAADPSETTNVASRHAALVETLRAEFQSDFGAERSSPPGASITRHCLERIDPSRVFDDGFESGTWSAWSEVAQ